MQGTNSCVSTAFSSPKSLSFFDIYSRAQLAYLSPQKVTTHLVDALNLFLGRNDQSLKTTLSFLTPLIQIGAFVFVNGLYLSTSLVQRLDPLNGIVKLRFWGGAGFGNGRSVLHGWVVIEIIIAIGVSLGDDGSRRRRSWANSKFVTRHDCRRCDERVVVVEEEKETYYGGDGGVIFVCVACGIDLNQR
jgi:hypothetical protein